MNKVIVKRNEEVEESKSTAELRRLNATFDPNSEDDISHSGVKGMKWGVRKSEDKGSGSNKNSFGSKLNAAITEVYADEAKEAADWAAAGKTVSPLKKVLIEGLAGRHYGTKILNAMDKKNSDPKEIVKKETKALRKSIMNEWASKSDKVLSDHEKDFKEKYGKASLKSILTKSGRAENTRRADIYTKELTKRMENSLREIAAKQLSGTSYKITAVKGFNDWEPEFKITPDKLKHSDISEEKSWMFIVERDEDGFVKSAKIPEDFLEVTDDELSFLDEKNSEDDIEHSGILGMKWGVRKSEDGSAQKRIDEKKAAILAKAEEKSLNKSVKKALDLAGNNYTKVYNAMADESMEFYSKINNSPKYKNKLNLIDEPKSKLSQEYYKECADTATKSLQKHSDRILGPKVDPRVKITWHMNSPDQFPTFYIEKVVDDIKHAYTNEDRIELPVIFDKETGLIIKFDIPEELVNSEDISHSGVLGMKWGVRKEENSSGETKKSHFQRSFEQKYDKSGKVANLISKAKVKVKEEIEKNKLTPEEKKVISERKSIARNRRTMSDETLNKVANRIQLEKKVKGLVYADVAPGRTAAKNILGKLGNATLGAAAGAAGGALIAKALHSKEAVKVVTNVVANAAEKVIEN